MTVLDQYDRLQHDDGDLNRVVNRCVNGLRACLRATGDAAQREVPWPLQLLAAFTATESQHLHHRGEVAAALTALGHSPGELDVGVCYPSRVIEEL